jgi:hypothetical protein
VDLRTVPTSHPSAFLAEDDVVDLRHPAVQAVHHGLAGDDPDDATYLRRAPEHVRDRVRHSYDVADPRVTVRASEVAEAGVGLCCAQSHLLVALPRARCRSTGGGTGWTPAAWTSSSTWVRLLRTPPAGPGAGVPGPWAVGTGTGS